MSKKAKVAKTVKTDAGQPVEFVNHIKVGIEQRLTAVNALTDIKARESQARQLKTALNVASFDKTMQSAAQAMQQTDFAHVGQVIANSVKTGSSASYVQVKSICKIVDLLHAVSAQRQPRDNNSRIGISAMLQNAHHANVRELIVAQSNAARETVSNFAIRDDFNVRSARYSIGTASSQTGQVRDVLRVLNLATVSKGSRADDATLTQYGIDVLSKLFA